MDCADGSDESDATCEELCSGDVWLSDADTGCFDTESYLGHYEKVEDNSGMTVHLT